MITIEKREIKSCCGKKQMTWHLNVPFSKDHLLILSQAGFPYLKQYYDAGILYIEDRGLTASGPFGQNILRIRCKSKACEDSLNKLEKTILSQF